MRWPQNLVEDIAARRAVIFFGSGVSLNSSGTGGKRPASWWTFLDSLKTAAKKAKKLKGPDLVTVERLLAENDLLSVCDVLKAVIGREEFVRKIRAEYKEPKYAAADIHRHIYSLDLRVVVTPNFDEIFDNYAASTSGGTTTVKQYNDGDLAEYLRGNERVVLKIHGSVSHPNELIFTRTEYAKARTEHRSFYTLIGSLLRTHSFLFLGAGLSDPDIRLLLEDYTYSYSHSRRHYFAIPDDVLGPKSSQVIGDSLNLEFINYSAANNHAALTVGMGELVKLVEQDRVRLADAQLW